MQRDRLWPRPQHRDNQDMVENSTHHEIANALKPDAQTTKPNTSRSHPWTLPLSRHLITDSLVPTMLPWPMSWSVPCWKINCYSQDWITHSLAIFVRFYPMASVQRIQKLSYSHTAFKSSWILCVYFRGNAANPLWETYTRSTVTFKLTAVLL